MKAPTGVQPIKNDKGSERLPSKEIEDFALRGLNALLARYERNSPEVELYSLW